MRQLYTLCIAALCSLSSCCLFIHQNDYHYAEFTAPSRNTNVCAHLKDSVILYAVFVDVGRFHPFSEYDIHSTMDSIHKATRWIEEQAELNNMPLSINPVMHTIGRRMSFHESKTLARPNLNLFRMPGEKRKYTRYTNNWADYMSRYASKGVKPKRSNKVTRTKIFNTETLIATLRDKYKTDNIALMFFVNGYYEHDACLTFNSYSHGPEVEYSVVTQKNPAAIAHEFFHLFGAVDLYPHPHHPGFNYNDLEEKYPDEIMRIAHKNLPKLMISPITKYYIGWCDTMPNPDLRLLYHQADVIGY